MSEVVDWFYVAQKGMQWRALVYILMEFWVGISWLPEQLLASQHRPFKTKIIWIIFEDSVHTSNNTQQFSNKDQFIIAV
jgi:hypothetical protein